MILEDVFEKYKDEYLKFEKVSPKHDNGRSTGEMAEGFFKNLHSRPDVCAFIFLHLLVGGEGDMISAAEHDEIWLDVDCGKLSKVASEEDILYLVRCGIRYNKGTDSLCMFV